MKKICIIYLNETSHSKVFYLSLILLSLIFYACRKNDFNSSFSSDDAISEKAKIKPAEISQWLTDLSIPVKIKDGNGQATISGVEAQQSKLPFPIQWNKAQQRIIKGKHVVRIPVSKDACMVFIKEKENEPVSVYAYKWHDEDPGKQKFSGKVAWFSFQDYQMRGQKFDKGSGSSIIKFKGKEVEIPVKLTTLNRSKLTT